MNRPTQLTAQLPIIRAGPQPALPPLSLGTSYSILGPARPQATLDQSCLWGFFSSSPRAWCAFGDAVCPSLRCSAHGLLWMLFLTSLLHGFLTAHRSICGSLVLFFVMHTCLSAGPFSASPEKQAWFSLGTWFSPWGHGSQ